MSIDKPSGMSSMISNPRKMSL